MCPKKAHDHRDLFGGFEGETTLNTLAIWGAPDPLSETHGFGTIP